MYSCSYIHAVEGGRTHDKKQKTAEKEEVRSAEVWREDRFIVLIDQISIFIR